MPMRPVSNKKLQMFFKVLTKIKRAKKMIYFTEYNFHQSGESVLMAAKSSDAGPQLKVPY